MKIAKIRWAHIKDMIINVGAYAVPIGFNQLVLIPYFAFIYNAEMYATIIAITSLINMIPNTLSRSLGNVRLVRDIEYSDGGGTGDFQTLMLVAQTICLVTLMVAALPYIELLGISNYLLLALVCVGWCAREYYCFAFRLRLNFSRVFWNNIVLVIGYAIGILVFQFVGMWPLIYLLGQLASCAYIFSRTDMQKERPCLSKRFRKTASDYGWLTVSDFMTSALSNADKLLVLPILGSSSLAVYYAASVVPRMMGLAVTPVNSVMLSYLSKKRSKDGGIFNLVLVSGFGVALVGFVVMVFAGPFILRLLYPLYAEEAAEYVVMTSAITAITVIISLVRPFVLRFCSMVWQVVINGSCLIIAFSIALLLIPTFQIWGVCIALLLADMAKLIIFLLVYRFTSRLEDERAPGGGYGRK